MLLVVQVILKSEAALILSQIFEVVSLKLNIHTYLSSIDYTKIPPALKSSYNTK